MLLTIGNYYEDHLYIHNSGWPDSGIFFDCNGRNAEDVNLVAQNACALAHDTIRATQNAPVADLGKQILDMIKIDHTFMYGNNVGMLKGAGNVALARHSALPDILNVCTPG